MKSYHSERKVVPIDEEAAIIANSSDSPRDDDNGARGLARKVAAHHLHLHRDPEPNPASKPPTEQLHPPQLVGHGNLDSPSPRDQLSETAISAFGLGPSDTEQDPGHVPEQQLRQLADCRTNLMGPVDLASLERSALVCPSGIVFPTERSSTSISIQWTTAESLKFPLYGYRVSCARGETGAFEVVYANTLSKETCCVVVGLQPGTLYRFHVAALTAQDMVLPESSVMSQPVFTLEADYEKAWFFEGSPEDRKWLPYEGASPEEAESDTSRALLGQITCDITDMRCFSGLRSLHLSVPEGNRGGVYVDVSIEEGCLYICHAMVYHEQPPDGCTKLVLWDMGHKVEMSHGAEHHGQWEPLTCRLTSFQSERLRIGLQTGGGYSGELFLDAVRLQRGGPTEVELASGALLSAMEWGRPPPKEIDIRVVDAKDLKSADVMGGSDPYVKVIWNGIEIGQTKVLPMTLNPVWDMTFRLSVPQDPTFYKWELQLQLWDFDVNGPGDYLGEVFLDKEALITAPPHMQNLPIMLRGADPETGAPVLTRGQGTMGVAINNSRRQDALSKYGRLVTSLMDSSMGRTASLTITGELVYKKDPRRQDAMGQLKSAATIQSADVVQALKAKTELVEQCAPEVASANLLDADLHKDAVALLEGMVTFTKPCMESPLGYKLAFTMQRHLLKLHPAKPLLAGWTAGTMDAEQGLNFLAKLYRGQQEALHQDVIGVGGLFEALVKHSQLQPAQALLREISGGHKPLDFRIEALFRRHREDIPLVRGVWRPELLEKFNRTTMDSAGTGGPQGGLPQQEVEEGQAPRTCLSLVCQLIPGAIILLASSALLSARCEEPIAPLLLLDGLLLLALVLGARFFLRSAEYFSHKVTLVILRSFMFSCVGHIVLFVSISIITQAVTAATCSSTVRTFGMAYMVLGIIGKVGLILWYAHRWFIGVEQATLQEVLAGK